MAKNKKLNRLGGKSVNFDDSDIRPPLLLQEWAHHIVALCESEVENAYYISVSGSILGNKFNKGSDIDVLVLYDGPELPYNGVKVKCEICDGRFLEVAMMPYFRLIQNFDMAPRSSNSVFLNIVCRSIALKDDLHMQSTIKLYAKHLYKKGPLPISEEQKNKFRRGIFELIHNVRYATDEIERRIDAFILFSATAEGLLRYNRLWIGGKDRWLYRALIKSEADIPLARELAASISKNSLNDILTISEKVLDLFGGPIDDRFEINNI